MMSVIGLMYFTYVKCITTQYPVHQQISLLMNLHLVINPICLLTKHWISAPFPQHRISLIPYGEAGRKLLTPSHGHRGGRRRRQTGTGAHWSYLLEIWCCLAPPTWKCQSTLGASLCLAGLDPLWSRKLLEYPIVWSFLPRWRSTLSSMHRFWSGGMAQHQVLRLLI
mgnify:CR=1 FL=1